MKAIVIIIVLLGLFFVPIIPRERIVHNAKYVSVYQLLTEAISDQSSSKLERGFRSFKRRF